MGKCWTQFSGCECLGGTRGRKHFSSCRGDGTVAADRGEGRETQSNRPGWMTWQPSGHCVCLRVSSPNASLPWVIILRFIVLIHHDLISELQKWACCTTSVTFPLSRLKATLDSTLLKLNSVFPPYFSDQCVTCPVVRSGELASILDTCPAPTLTPAQP